MANSLTPTTVAQDDAGVCGSEKSPSASGLQQGIAVRIENDAFVRSTHRYVRPVLNRVVVMSLSSVVQSKILSLSPSSITSPKFGHTNSLD